jgi:hypothetical protein
VPTVRVVQFKCCLERALVALPAVYKFKPPELRRIAVLSCCRPAALSVPVASKFGQETVLSLLEISLSQ